MVSSPTPSSAQVRRVSGRKKLNSALSRSMLSVTRLSPDPRRRTHASCPPPSQTIVAPHPPRPGGASAKRSTSGLAARTLVDAPPLHAPAAAVDQPDLAEARLQGGFEVGLHDRRDLARREGVQVERVL